MAIVLGWEDARGIDVSEDSATLPAVTDQGISLDEDVAVAPVALLLEVSGWLGEQDGRLLLVVIVAVGLGSEEPVVSSVGDRGGHCLLDRHLVLLPLLPLHESS